MIYAIFNYPDNGYDDDVEYAQQRGLVKGYKYEMVDASIGQSGSHIYLKEVKGFFNSVQFDFVDENGDTVDICRHPTYNPYYGLSKH